MRKESRVDAIFSPPFCSVADSHQAAESTTPDQRSPSMLSSLQIRLVCQESGTSVVIKVKDKRNEGGRR